MEPSKEQQRVALGAYFFLLGFCFATWASRIPTIKDNFDLNEAELGNLLFVMPLSSMIGLVTSGWLVSRFNSRFPLFLSFALFVLCLFSIGLVGQIFWLVVAVGLLAFFIRIANVSVNTQSIVLQKGFKKSIIGSFHGLWSLGGVAGVLFSTLMVRLGFGMQAHFLYACSLSLIFAIIAFPFLLAKDRSSAGNRLRLGKPDKFILYLGLMVFFAAICEGGMFDWSGVYFKEVVKEEIFTLGYLIFMTFMAASRFFSDRLIELFGMRRMYLFSAAVVSLGIFLVIVFPEFWTALIGFSLVGIGVASVIPMTYMLAGKSTKYSPGMAISIVSTYGIVGMLIGPPLVGYLAYLTNLQMSFLLFLFAGMMIIPLSRMLFKGPDEHGSGA